MAFLRRINSFFFFRRLMNLLVPLVIVIQLVVLLSSHWLGIQILESFNEFLFRLFFGFLFGLMGSLLVSYPFLYIIRILNRVAPWGKLVFKRIVLQLLSTILISIVVSTAITVLAYYTIGFEDPLRGKLIGNGLIYIVVNILLVTFLEAWIYYEENKSSAEVTSNLKKELSQIKFEMLKSQINPHFLFNSLNVLSGLIQTDVYKAQVFIDEFSCTYRYVLETIEQPMVSLRDELNFFRSYFSLYQMRYGRFLTNSIRIPARLLSFVLPPLSLQTVFENAVKHNIINEQNPFEIEIYTDADFLYVRNKIQPKPSAEYSSKLGLKNLKRRYSFIGDNEPEFYIENNYYVAKLPLLELIENEGINH